MSGVSCVRISLLDSLTKSCGLNINIQYPGSSANTFNFRWCWCNNKRAEDLREFSLSCPQCSSLLLRLSRIRPEQKTSSQQLNHQFINCRQLQQIRRVLLILLQSSSCAQSTYCSDIQEHPITWGLNYIIYIIQVLREIILAHCEAAVRCLYRGRLTGLYNEHLNLRLGWCWGKG